MDKAIESLVNSGDVEEITEQTGGRPRKIVRAKKASKVIKG